MQTKFAPPWSYFSIRLMAILCAAVAALLAVPRASAQGAAAGPLPAAAPSDRPTTPAAPPPPKPRALTIGGKPNLSGTWVLNKDESDDARQKLADARSSSGQGGGQRPGWGGGQGGQGGGQQGGGGVWGPGGSGYPRGGGGGRQGQRSSNADEPMEELSQLTIAQTESTVNVTSETGHTLASYPASNQSQSGSSSSDSSGSSSKSANPTVEWKDNQLVVTEQRDRGGSTTRTYELSPDGNQLYVTTTLQSPRFKNPVTIRFVYDPAPSGG